MIIKAKVSPNSSTESIQLKEHIYHIRVTVPPEAGKATKRVMELLAEEFDVAKTQVVLKSGSKSRHKLFEVHT